MYDSTCSALKAIGLTLLLFGQTAIGAEPNRLPVRAPHVPQAPAEQKQPLEPIEILLRNGLFPRTASQVQGSTWQIETVAPRGLIESLAWSPDKRRLACADWLGQVRLFDTSTWSLAGVLIGHEKGQTNVAWSPDGNWLATTGSEGTIRVWQADGTPVSKFEEPCSCSALAWSPDNQRIASAYVYRTIVIRDRGGKRQLTLEGHAQTVMSLAWNPVGKQLASFSADGEIRLWQVPDDMDEPLEFDIRRREARDRFRVPSTVLKGHKSAGIGLDWHPDGECLASGDGAGVIKLWDKSGKLRSEFKQSKAVGGLAWSPRGNRLATTQSERISLWKEDGTLERTLERAGETWRRLAWSPDGERLAATAGAAQLYVWEVDGEAAKVVSGYLHQMLYVRPVNWNPQGTSLDFATMGNRMQFFSDKGVPGVSWPLPEKTSVRVAWTPDHSLLATCSFGDRAIRFWKPDGSPGPVLPELCRLGEWNATGEQLAIGSGRTIRFVNRQGQVKTTLEMRSENVSHLTWSPDGEWLAVGGDVGLELWSAAGKPGPLLKGHTAPIASLTWHPKSDRLASMDRTGLVRLWKVDGTPGPLLDRHKDHGRDVSWSPDGAWLASGGLDTRLYTPEGNSGAIIRPEHGAAVDRLQWSPRGDWLAIQFSDAIRLRQPNGKPGPLIQGPKLAPNSWTWSPTGTQLASTTMDDTCLVWSAESGELAWVGLVMKNGRAATVTSQGSLIADDTQAFDREFAFLGAEPSGRISVLKASEFREFQEPRRGPAR